MSPRDDDPVFPIGQAAAASCVSAPTIRYYEDIDLIPSPRRSAAGHRHYTRADIDRLTFIRRCRDFGFGLDQVRLLCGLETDPEQDCTAVREIAADHLASVRDKLAELHSLEAQLSSFVSSCDSACRGGPSGACVVLAELAER